MKPYYVDDSVTLYHGDCLDVLAELPDASVDSVVTDPPYGLDFMGKHWDTGAVAFDTAVWGHCLRVLKPGGHLLAFGGTRTWHRLAVAVEDAGFEIRDNIAWLYGSGFPKSLDVSKAIDKAAGAEREVMGVNPNGRNVEPLRYGGDNARPNLANNPPSLTAPATDDAKRWAGWGTALKPAFEPVVVARKPLVGTVAGNVLAHGVGALNIEACRVGTDERVNQSSAAPGGNGIRLHGGDGRDAENAKAYAAASKERPPTVVAGRWPSNVVIDGNAAAEIDRQSGYSKSPPTDSVCKTRAHGGFDGKAFAIRDRVSANGHGDECGASRFFPTFRYQAKAATDERPTANGIAHPTVKPLDLMRWLVRLVTPPGGLVIEPFAGSGTTAEACIHEHMRCIAIEREADYLPLIVARLSKPMEIGFDFGDAG